MVVYPNEEEATSGSDRFCDFVDKTLALLSNSHMKKLSLCHVPRPRHKDAYQRWFWAAMERGFLELHLHATHRYFGVNIKTSFLTSKTLVKLTLSGEFSLELDRVFFPALKSLSLVSVLGLDCPNYCRLLDGCSVLEDLFITDADHWYLPCCGVFVESPCIKRLVVFVNLPDTKEYHRTVYFKASRLVYLDYSSYVSKQYQFVDFDLLVEARLSLRLWESTNNHDDDDSSYFYDDDDDDDDDDFSDEHEPIFGDVTNLVAGISNILTLHLSPESLEVFHFCCKSMPVFNNLLKLSIESNKEKGWQVMPLLIKSCPNLQTLVIKGLVHRVTNRCGDACACIPKKHSRKNNKKRKIVKEEELCCLWTCHVKVLEISEYKGSFQELKLMRHFLGKLKCLETVKVSVDEDKYKDNEFLRANLLALPRVSSKCNIQFI
ncbi:F-box/LRR-repeat protein At1g48400 isoform X2 [Capsella rubella]|nr:F-box/LRR-repeat protein At1g48400 isoform X2 [Capsella rubella]